jgi:hypothetical protein
MRTKINIHEVSLHTQAVSCVLRALSNLRDVAKSQGTTHLAGTRQRGGRVLGREASRRAPSVQAPAHRGEGDGTGGEMARVAPAT